MFSNPIRRATFATSSSPIPSAQLCARLASRQTTSSSLQQRRLSSSKPSDPFDELTQEEKEAALHRRRARLLKEQKESAAQRRDLDVASSKQKSPKEVAAACTVKGRDESMQNLPSVPSTHHLKIKDISASSFFSLYRPLSVTSSFPKPVTQETFNSIFTPQPLKNKSAEVIATLSNALGKLEMDADADLHQLRLDDPNERMKFPHHIMTGRYRPFNAPPPPTPMNTEESLAAGLEAVEEAMVQNQPRIYTAVLTVEETTDEHGGIRYSAHSTPLELEEESLDEQPLIQTPFANRMSERRSRYKDSITEKRRLWAISVKRQRKLKMKKHKYKKLMKKTRNIRRRLDRT